MGAGLDVLGLAVATMAYNRDAYANNLTMNQTQMYQEKNYLITFITAVREELRDVMSIFVGRMSNYILVSTLLFGFAAVLVCEGPAYMQVGDAPRVLVQIFSISACLTLVSHVCCILIALKGLAASYEQAMKCLTEFTPEAPDEYQRVVKIWYNFNYLEQCTLGFEQSGEVWRLPLTDYPWWCLPVPETSRWFRRNPLKDTLRRWRPQLPKPSKKRYIREELPRNRWKHAAPPERNVAEAGESPGDAAFNNAHFDTYFKHIETLTGSWEPIKEATRLLLAHSVMENVQALAFFALGRYHNIGLHFSKALCLMLTSLGIIIMWQFKDWFQVSKSMRPSTKRFLAVMLLSAAGPILCVLMLPLLHPSLHSVLGLLCSLVAMIREVCLISLIPVPTHEHERQAQKQSQVHCTVLPSGGPTSSIAAECDGIQQQDSAHSMQSVRSTRSVPDATRTPADEPRNRGEFVEHLEKVVQESMGMDPGRIGHLGPSEAKLIICFNGFSCFWWAASFALFASGLYGVLEVRQQNHVGDAVVTGQLHVTWPSNRFLPRALACDGGRVFVADEFNIYELVASSDAKAQAFHLQPWPCYLTRRVADITVMCEDNGACQPLVLLQGQPSEVVDCAVTNESPLTLLQASPHVDHMAAWNSSRILTVEGKDALLRMRNRVDQRNLFQALWPIAEVPQSQHGMLRAVDTVNGRMLSFFFAGGTESRPAVVRHEVANKVSLTWELPSDLPTLLTGCIETQDSILVVASSDSSHQQPEIIRMDLEAHRL